jgi:hypothetical protein
MKMKVLLMLILGSLWLAGCSDDPATEGVNLQMKAVTNLSTIDNGRTNTTGLEFNQVLLGVRELEFETQEEDDQEDSDDDSDGDDDDGEDDNEDIEFKGSYVVDLINGTSTPDFGLATLQPGVYEEIEIELGPVLPDNNSVFIAFTYTPDGGTPVQVELSTKKELEFEIEHNKSGYQLDANTLTNILVLLDLDVLFSSVDLSTAEADDDGVIRINDTSNSKLVLQILSRFEDACEAGEDADDDDDIDED